MRIGGKWVQVRISYVRSSILVNGSLMGYFTSSSGLGKLTHFCHFFHHGDGVLEKMTTMLVEDDTIDEH